MHRIVLLVLLASSHLYGMEYSVVQSATYDKQKEFTKLVHEIAAKENKTTEYIATQFETSTAKQYIDLFNELTRAVTKDIIFKSRPIHEIIADGVDLNYTSDDKLPILFSTVELGAWPETLEILLYLLENGADIHTTHHKEGTILKYTRNIFFSRNAMSGHQDYIFKFLLDAYCKSLPEDECIKIKKQYRH